MTSAHDEVSSILSQVESWRVQETTTVSFQGLDWVLLPDVFPIQRSHSSAFAWEVLRELEPVDSFLDIGCGPGNNVVLALQSGLCRTATGVDINANSVESAKINTERHGVAASAKLLVSDMFNSLSGEDKFDLVFWNSPPALEGVDPDSLSVHERSFFDPAYDCNIRFFSQARRHLAEGGRLMIGFCSNGEFDRMKQIAAESNFVPEIVAERGEGHPHWLVDFRDTTK